ncbi:MAG: PAS domain S-box protein [Candidatus Sumerlaeaceae bacterium]
MTGPYHKSVLPNAGINADRLLETLFDSVRDGVAITDDQGRIICCNAALAMLGQRPISDIIGHTPAELWKSVGNQGETSGETTAREDIIERPDGSRRTVAVRCYELGGEPAATAVLYRDITHLKLLERRGRESDKQYKLLLEHVNDGILITQNDTIVYANSHLSQMLGCHPAELALLNRKDLGYSGGESDSSESRFETIFTRKDGSTIDVEIVKSAGYYAEEAAVFEVVRDITRRRRIERRSSVLLPLGQRLNLASTDKEVARVTLQAAQELIGWHSSTLELMEHPNSHILHPVIFFDTINGEITEVPPPTQACRVDSLAARALQQGPLRINRKPDETAEGYRAFGDTSRRSMSLMFVPIRGGDDTVGVMSVQCYDADSYTDEDLEALQALAEHCSGALQRTVALASLRSSEQRYRQMFEKNLAIKLVLEPGTTQVVDANPAACRYYGYSLEQLKNMRFSDVTVSEHVEMFSHFNDAMAEQQAVFTAKHRLSSGVRRTVEISASPLEVNGRTLLHTILHDVTERERAVAQVEALAELGQRLNSALSSIEAGRILVDVADKLIGWDACFVDLFASDVDQNAMKPGHLLLPVVHIDNVRGQRQEVAPLNSVLPATSISYRVLQEGAYMILRSPGEMKLRPGQMFGDSGRPSASLMYVPIRGTAGVLGVLSIQSYKFNAYTASDLQMLQSLADHCGGALERTRAEEQVRLLESAVRLSSDMVIITAADPGSPTGTRIVFANDAVCQATGYLREELMGQSLAILQGPDTDREVLAQMRDALQAGSAITVELTNYKKDGTKYVVEFSAYSISDDYGRPRYFVSVQRDITARKRTEHELVHRAFHDPLTGLANRALLFERLEHILARSSRSSERFAVLFLDLDGFKAVNDQFGHDVGDLLLVSVARRLETCVRPGDTVARLGGDEFVILLEGVESNNDAKCVGDRVLEVFNTSHEVGGHTLMCGASIGIAQQPQGRTTPTEVLKLADNALYSAKARGKKRYEMFGEPLSPLAD